MKNIFGFLFVVVCIFTTMIPLHAQWIQTNGPGGTYSIDVFAVSGTNLFAGSGGDGVFLSTNNGTSWSAVNTGLTNIGVITLAVSGTNLFAGTSSGGVFLSTNNRTNWTTESISLTSNDVRALAVFGTNLFAGTYGSGVFLSTNNGTSWTKVTTGLTNFSVQALAVSGTNLFAGTFLGGVFFSTNNGASWTVVNTGLTSTDVLALAVSGTNLYAGTSGGVFLSTNNGTSWTKVNTGMTTTWVNALAISGTNLFAGTTDGVFLSTNNGASWTAVNTGLTNTDFGALTVSGTNLYAGISAGVWRRPLSEMITSVTSTITVASPNGGENWQVGSSHGITWTSTNVTNVMIEYSTNNGSSWNTIVTSAPASSGSYSWTVPNAPSVQCKVRVSDAANATTVYDVSDNVFTISSGATHYNVSYQAGPNMNMNRMGQYSLVLPSGNVVVLGGHGTNFVSLNTADVYSPTTNAFALLTMKYIHDYAAVSDLSDGTWLIAGGANDLGVAPGTTGAEIYNPSNGSFTACSPLVYSRCMTTGVRLANNNILLVGGWYDQTSATYGEVFNSSTKSFSLTKALNTPRSNAVAVATADSGAVVFGGYYYYGTPSYETVEYYNAKTNTFTQLQNHLFPNDSGWCIQNDVFQRPMSSQQMKNGQYLIYAWKQNPTQYTLGTFNPSTKSFARLNLSTSLPSADSIIFFRAPIVDTAKNLAYWFGVKTNTNPEIIQLYIIDLTNQTWQASQLYTASYYWSYQGMSLLNNGKILITGGTTSNDYNTNFTPVNNTVLVSLSPVTGVIENDLNRNQPTTYRLSQNYPNPFNPATTISFSLPSKSFVSLKVFDMIGKEVATIVSEEMSAGSYSRRWNAASLPSGIYFYRLQAGSFTETKKLVLLR
jgi:hypothetical protein